MPTSDGIDYRFKYVNEHPKNMKEGLQTVAAFGILTQVDTDYPTLLCVDIFVEYPEQPRVEG